MILSDSLKIFLSLCDEYAPNSNISNLWTTDEDIRTKVKLLYDTAYQRAGNYKTLSRTEILNFEYTGENKYEEVNLPVARMIKRIFCLDNDNNLAQGDFFFKDDTTVMINKGKDITFICEYIPQLSHIKEDTDLNFIFEIPDDIANIIPYWVASDFFKTDPSVNWQYFEQQANSMLQQILSSNMGISVQIIEGEL